MLTRSMRRLGAAAVLAVGLLAASSAPASASATGVVIEASSTFDLPPGFYVDYDQHVAAHPTTTVCAPTSSTPPTIPVALDSTGGGTIGATTLGWSDVPGSGITLKGRMIVVGGGLTLSTTGASVTLDMRYQVSNCASTTVMCTTNTFTVTMTGPSIGHHPTASTRVTVAGSSTPITTPFSCNSIIRSDLNGGVVNASLNLHFV